VSWPATFDASGGARYSPATIGVMIDESFSRVTNAIRPPGRSIVTSELSIDLVNMTSSGDTSLNCEAETLAVSVDAALAISSLKDGHGAIVAAATTWCRFIKSGHDESQTYPQAPKPPPDLDLNHLITATSTPGDKTVKALFTPNDRCTNDLGTLHGGIALAAALVVGLTWLRMIYGQASASSVRTNLLRPATLTDPIRIDAIPVHIGRSVAVTRVTSLNPAGKPTTIATVTGIPLGTDSTE
jgi:acyl-coenzyme A thioesterase PaaI-like protein